MYIVLLCVRRTLYNNSAIIFASTLPTFNRYRCCYYKSIISSAFPILLYIDNLPIFNNTWNRCESNGFFISDTMTNGIFCTTSCKRNISKYRVRNNPTQTVEVFCNLLFQVSTTSSKLFSIQRNNAVHLGHLLNVGIHVLLLNGIINLFDS